MSFKEELQEVWAKEKTKLDRINPVEQKEAYRMQADRVVEIEKRLTDLERSETEVEGRAAIADMEDSLKRDQLEQEKKDQKVKNIIDILKIAVPASAAFAMGLISMVWEKTDTLTSTAGKSSLRDVLKFK